MQDIGSALVKVGLVLVVLLLFRTGCQTQPSREPMRTLQTSQKWQLQPGDAVAGHPVVAGLGDISIELKGGSVQVPFTGRVQRTRGNCVLFSSDEVPAYLFRLCGLERPRLGELKQGTAIGSGQYLHFAALRKQPNGTWSFVEPSRTILERMLSQPK